MKSNTKKILTIILIPILVGISFLFFVLKKQDYIKLEDNPEYNLDLIQFISGNEFVISSNLGIYKVNIESGNKELVLKTKHPVYYLIDYDKNKRVAKYLTVKDKVIWYINDEKKEYKIYEMKNQNLTVDEVFRNDNTHNKKIVISEDLKIIALVTDSGILVKELATNSILYEKSLSIEDSILIPSIEISNDSRYIRYLGYIIDLSTGEQINLPKLQYKTGQFYNNDLLTFTVDGLRRISLNNLETQKIINDKGNEFLDGKLLAVFYPYFIVDGNLYEINNKILKSYVMNISLDIGGNWFTVNNIIINLRRGGNIQVFDIIKGERIKKFNINGVGIFDE